MKSGEIWKITQGKYSGYYIHFHNVSEHDVIGKIVNLSVPEAKISHMPFSEKAILKSEIQFISGDANLGKEWQEGYSIWKSAFEDGDAGVYSITISEALDVMFETINTGTPVNE